MTNFFAWVGSYGPKVEYFYFNTFILLRNKVLGIFVQVSIYCTTCKVHVQLLFWFLPSWSTVEGLNCLCNGKKSREAQTNKKTDKESLLSLALKEWKSTLFEAFIFKKFHPKLSILVIKYMWNVSKFNIHNFESQHSLESTYYEVGKIFSFSEFFEN